MATLKKFWLYFLMFIALFLLVTILTNITMSDKNNNIIDYEIVENSPAILVNECKAGYSHGNIKGTVTNDTGNYIELKYLKLDFYDKDGIYVGTEYKELKYFHANEAVNFDIDFNYNNVEKVVLGFSDKMEKSNEYSFFGNIDDKELEIALPIAGLLTLYVILP